MTGFARSEGQNANNHWVWELRSVNGKGLDIRFRLPPGFESLDQPLRKSAGQVLSRGNIQAALSLDIDHNSTIPSLNLAALDAIADAIDMVGKRMKTRRSTAAEILGMRGVLEFTNTLQPEVREELTGALVSGFGAALSALVDSRSAEGRELEAILLKHISQIENLTNQAEADPANDAAAIRERIADQISRITEATDASLDSGRLHQEALVLAAKSDIREELDRLHAHCSAARELIAAGSPVGRKLDFLAQEFNREANTLCAKSGSVTLTAIGLELKAAIDQFREQILNVE